MTHTQSTPNIAFLGGGNMATAIITGMIKQGGFSPSRIHVVEHNEAQRDRLHQDLGVAVYENTAFAHLQMPLPDMWVLAVKPQSMQDALRELTPKLNSTQTLVSIAAGLSLASLSAWAGGHTAIVRTMPNTPALVGQGITGIYAPNLDQTTQAWVQKLFQSIGQTVWLTQESQIDDITAISGSGPAYVFYIMEQLIKDAEQLGFDTATARQLVQGTFSGAIALAGESTETIATLRERVTSKGGTTAAALQKFGECGLDQAIHQGVQACHQRAKTLAIELSQTT